MQRRTGAYRLIATSALLLLGTSAPALALSGVAAPDGRLQVVAETPGFEAEQVMQPIDDGPATTRLPSIAALTIDGTFACNVIAVTDDIVAAQNYCVSNGPPESLAVVPLADGADPLPVTEIAVADNVWAAEGAEELLGTVAFLRTGPHGLVPVGRDDSRAPVRGEKVMAVGYSDLQFFRAPAPSAAADALDLAAFSAEACTVTATNPAAGTFTTDCVTAPGTSGSPIYGTDGKLLGAVSWGPQDETNSPVMLLAYDTLDAMLAGTAASVLVDPPAPRAALVPEPLSALDPLLAPAGEADAALVASLLALTHDKSFACTALPIDSGRVVTPAHCTRYADDTRPQGMVLVPLPAATAGLADLLLVDEIEVLGTERDGGEDAELGRFAILHVAGAVAPAIEVRAPMPGEAVHVVGYANSQFFAPGELPEADAMLDVIAFATGSCTVLEVDYFLGTFATDCVTTISTSGSPIVADSDGAVLGMVGWGDSADDTQSGLLAMAMDELAFKARTVAAAMDR